MDDTKFLVSEITTHEADRSCLATTPKCRVHYCFNKYRHLMAVKLVKLFGTSDSVDHSRQRAISEIENLKTMKSSENIVQYYGTVSFRDESWIGILMEYMPYGNLHDFLQPRSYARAPINLRLRILFDIAKGLEELHKAHFKQRIAHNDLKPQNILLNATLRAKICDFGGSDFAPYTSASAEEGSIPSGTHTDHYAAREFLLQSNARRTRAMDVFSYAMVMYYTLTNKKPFDGRSVYQIESGYRSQPDARPEIIPTSLQYCIQSDADKEIYETLIGIMESCWHTNPDRRKTMMDVRKELKKELKKQIASETVDHIVYNDTHEWIRKHSPDEKVWDSSCISLEKLCRRIDGLPERYDTIEGHAVPELQDANYTPFQGPRRQTDGFDGQFSQMSIPDVPEIEGTNAHYLRIAGTTHQSLDVGDQVKIQAPNGVFKLSVTERIE